MNVQLGLRMPAEWERHAATWTGWPFDEEEWLGYLEAVRAEYAIFVNRLAEHEPVHLLVHDDEVEEDARRRLKGNVHFHRQPLDDVWLRDSGPIFVRDNGHLKLTHWRFNAWGEKFKWQRDARVPERVAEILGAKRIEIPVVLEGGSIEVNGQGAALTTRQCLLNPNRNRTITQQEAERLLREHLGVEKTIWLDEGLEGDHTDGHIDTIARFVNPDTVVCCVTDDRSDPNYETLKRNRKTLEQHFHTIPVPIAKARRYILNERLPLTYVNFYIANGIVLVPQYQEPEDEQALQILAPLFPGRKVEGLPARNIIVGGGAFHCLTQQQPEGALAR